LAREPVGNALDGLLVSALGSHSIHIDAHSGIIEPSNKIALRSALRRVTKLLLRTNMKRLLGSTLQRFDWVHHAISLHAVVRRSWDETNLWRPLPMRKRYRCCPSIFYQSC